MHEFSNLIVTTCTGPLRSLSYEIISIVCFSFHGFIDADRIDIYIMAKHTNSSGRPPAKLSQMDLLLLSSFMQLANKEYNNHPHELQQAPLKIKI